MATKPSTGQQDIYNFEKVECCVVSIPIERCDSIDDELSLQWEF